MTGVKSTRMFSRIMKGFLSPLEIIEAEKADAYVDGTLLMARTEEPTLQEWLEQDPELKRALDATLSSIYYSIMKDNRKGMPVEYTLSKVDTLIFRIVATAAVRAVNDSRSTPSIMGAINE